MESQKDGIVLYHASLDLSREDEAFFSKAVRSFLEEWKRIGGDREIRVDSIPADLLDRINAVSLQTDNVVSRLSLDVDDYCQNQSSHELVKVILGCSRKHVFAEGCRNKNMNAEWGAANRGGLVGFTYKPGNRHVIWHEILHLLGADDCYEDAQPEKGPTCEERKCVMQWVPTEENCGSDLVLCEKNIGRIKEHLGRLLSV